MISFHNWILCRRVSGTYKITAMVWQDIYTLTGDQFEGAITAVSQKLSSFSFTLGLKEVPQILDSLALVGKLVRAQALCALLNVTLCITIAV